MLSRNWPDDICKWAGGVHQDCSAYWTAWSVLITFVAVVIALLLPMYTSHKEWARQDRIRTDEKVEERKAKVGVIHEVCSAVEQILAYHNAALGIARCHPVYHVAHEACSRIRESLFTLSEMLDILARRPELSDGAMYSAVGARRVAKTVIIYFEQTKDLNYNGWIEISAHLANMGHLAGMVEKRIEGVRDTAELPESRRAAKVRKKYDDLIKEITDARVNDRVPNVPNLEADPY